MKPLAYARDMVRVLVIDDDVHLTRALAAALEREGFEIGVAHSAADGTEKVAMSAPDVVVLDLRLPDEDGVDVIRRLRAWSEVPVLILSGVTDQRRRVEALDAGADDFLQKPFGIDELVARLRALLRRSQGAAEQRSPVLTFARLVVDLTARLVLVDGDEVRLTPKEWRLLEAFVSHPGRLLTHTWLLSDVWDDGYGDETRAALRAHVRTLRAKIGDDATAPVYLRTDSGSGYRWIAEEVDRGSSEEPGSEPGAGAEEIQRVGLLGTVDLIHELNNALTALRLAVRLLRPAVPSEGEQAGPDVAVSLRVDEVFDRVSCLSVELERRANPA